jgi:Family of unknown function (DUF6454)
VSVFRLALFLSVLWLPPSGGSDPSRELLGDRAMTLTRESAWTLVTTIPIKFQTHHPQGMVKIGDTFYVSAVEVIRREAGEGVGHLFKIDASGTLVSDTRLGEGAIYHPGGMDFDGRDIWVPVAEYRRDSHSIVYRVDPATMKATEVFRFDDHLGAVVRDTDDDTLHAVNWGSRRFYRWKIGSYGRAEPTLNPSQYVDYQDCKYAGRHRMLCTGVTEIHRPGDAAPFRLGGIDLVDLRDGRPLHQTPVLLWTPSGFDMTHNPVWIEPHGSGLRAYFMPEDNTSTIYVYDVAVTRA